MTTTPEHAKVEALKATNQLAGNLAFLLLDSDHWTLSNHRSEPVIDIQVQRVVSDILGIDFEAYQAERIALLGLSAPNLGVVAKVIGWSTEPALLTVDETLAARAAEADPVESDIAETTVDEASIIAAVAQAEDAVLVLEPVAFIPGDAEDDAVYFAEDDVHPAGQVSAAPDLSDYVPAEPVTEAEGAPDVLVVDDESDDAAEAFTAFIPAPEAFDEPAEVDIDVEHDGAETVEAGADAELEAAEPAPVTERIEIGSYQLIQE